MNILYPKSKSALGPLVPEDRASDIHKPGTQAFFSHAVNLYHVDISVRAYIVHRYSRGIYSRG